jgi:hypothetical protein
MARYTLVVMTNPVEGEEDRFNKWYNEQHIPDLLNVRGCVSAQRFRHTDPGSNPPHTYLALYEFEADSADAVRAALTEARDAGNSPVDDSLDKSTARSEVWEPIDL